MKRYLIILLTTLLALVSCQKEIEFDHAIGLMSEKNVLSSDSGSTPIIIYSNTDWTVGFDTEVDWASIDRLKGSGNGEVKFYYDANFGNERQVVVRFKAGSEEKTITMVQKKGN